MSILITSNFSEQAGLPIDDRMVVPDQTTRDAIPAVRRYYGLEVFVEADAVKYRLDSDLVTWIPLTDIPLPFVTAVTVPCDASVSVGDIVRWDGAQLVKAQANNYANSRAVGVCDSKSSSTVCALILFGACGQFTGLTGNVDYFLDASTAGAVTTTPPTGSGNVVLMIGKSTDSTTILINIGTAMVRD